MPIVIIAVFSAAHFTCKCIEVLTMEISVPITSTGWRIKCGDHFQSAFSVSPCLLMPFPIEKKKTNKKPNKVSLKQNMGKTTNQTRQKSVQEVEVLPGFTSDTFTSRNGPSRPGRVCPWQNSEMARQTPIQRAHGKVHSNFTLWYLRCTWAHTTVFKIKKVTNT